MIEIQPSSNRDIDAIMAIYAHARAFMRAQGNPSQWSEGYPSRRLILGEIEAGVHFSCFCNGALVGVFSFIIGEEPNYKYIKDGAWLNSHPYGTIHRLASAGVCRGVAHACLSWCAARIGTLRADTHRCNTVMQHILVQHGFVPCGIIYVGDGTERIAYQTPG